MPIQNKTMTAPLNKRTNPNFIKIITRLAGLLWIISFFGCVTTNNPVTTYSKPVDDLVENNDFIHQQGQNIVDGNGQKIILKGTIVEGWLQWQGPVLDCGFTSESTIKKKLVEVVGEEEFDKFQAAIYQNFFNEADIIDMKRLGFNVVRLAFNHAILEDDSTPYNYKESGWKLLDNIIQHCEKHQLYIVLDLHSTPGGQNPLFISDPDPIKLWQSEENQKRTVALWKAIANRYKSRKIIAGYDLLNEPDFPNGAQLVNLYADIVKAIREVDKKHLVFIEGDDLAHNFSDFTFPISHNMAYSFHTYHLVTFLEDKSLEALTKLARLAKEQNVPIWNGEFGAHNLEWTKKTVEMLNDPQFQNSGWIFWPWKRVGNHDNYRRLYGIESSAYFQKIILYFGLLGIKPTKDDAIKGLNDLAEAVKIENCNLDQEVMKILK